MWSMRLHFSNFHAQYTLREEEKRKGKEGRNSSVSVHQGGLHSSGSPHQFLSKVDLLGVFV